MMNCGAGRDKRVRGQDDFVPPPDTCGHQRDQESVGAIPDPEGMLNAEVLREIGLELVEILLQDELSSRKHALDRAQDLLALSREKCGVVEEWNRPDFGSVHEHQPS
jgi:hypothetical protein